jgi:hypothetical protein
MLAGSIAWDEQGENVWGFSQFQLMILSVDEVFNYPSALMVQHSSG